MSNTTYLFINRRISMAPKGTLKECDPRQIGDKNVTKQNTQTLLNYLLENNYPQRMKLKFVRFSALICCVYTIFTQSHINPDLF